MSTKTISLNFTLVFNNLIPLIGVLFFKWNLPYVFIIFWVEAILYCIFIFISKLFPRKQPDKLIERIMNPITYTMIFACFGYMLYIYGVGISIFTFSPSQIATHLAASRAGTGTLIPSISLLFPYLSSSIFPITLLVLTNMYNFLTSYFNKHRSDNSLVKEILAEKPFPTQLLILHLTIILGGAVLLLTTTAKIALVAFICVKFTVELLKGRRLSKHHSP